MGYGCRASRTSSSNWKQLITDELRRGSHSAFIVRQADQFTQFTFIVGLIAAPATAAAALSASSVVVVDTL